MIVQLFNRYGCDGSRSESKRKSHSDDQRQFWVPCLCARSFGDSDSPTARVPRQVYSEITSMVGRRYGIFPTTPILWTCGKLAVH